MAAKMRRTRRKRRRREEGRGEGGRRKGRKKGKEERGGRGDHDYSTGAIYSPQSLKY